LPKKKAELDVQPPMAKVLEEYVPEPDPWRTLRDMPGIRITRTARRMPGE